MAGVLSDTQITFVADPAHAQRNTLKSRTRTHTSNPVAFHYVTTWAIKDTDLTLDLAGVRYV